MANHLYDLIVIGAGPGGYIAAERAGANGKKVLLIEKSNLGGVCLNEGCIPSKTLLHSAKLFVQACNSQAYGVTVENPQFNLADAMSHKGEVIQKLRAGVAYQIKQNRVELLHGQARFANRNTVHVNGKQFQGENIIIAAGSSPVRLPIPGADAAHVLTSTEILEIENLPENLAIIGGGVVGCEFASFFSNVGVNVSVVEMLPEIIPTLDPEFARMLRKSMKDVDFHLGNIVESIGEDTVTFCQNGESTSIPCDHVLMSVGRKPNLEGLGLDEIGVDHNSRGVKVNEYMQTNIPGIYAIGDITGKSMLAHAAARMGEVAVRHILGKWDVMRYHAVPWVVYTYPEVAWVGLTEAEAADKGVPVKCAKLPMSANGRFLAENMGKRGLCKVVIDSDSNTLLGVQMIGAACSEIIYGAAAMIEDEFRVQDIQEVIFPHPTVSEIFKDALTAMHA